MSWVKSAADAALNLARGIGVAVLATIAIVDDWRAER